MSPCDRLAPMRLYTLSKRHFVLVFVLFLICFALTVFIGIAGMPDTHFCSAGPSWVEVGSHFNTDFRFWDTGSEWATLLHFMLALITEALITILAAFHHCSFLDSPAVFNCSVFMSLYNAAYLSLLTWKNLHMFVVTALIWFIELLPGHRHPSAVPLQYKGEASPQFEY